MKSALRTLKWTLVALIGAVLVVQCWFFAQVAWWAKFNPASTAFMEMRLDGLRAKNPAAKLEHQWVPYDRIAPSLKRAIVAAEDMKFLDHEGFDWEGIQKALEKNRKRGKIVAGGSTITQQLAKNLFLSGERTWWRKGQEAVITLMIEVTWSKRRILEVYLNVIEWGNGVFGAEAAARRYFGVSAAQLSPEQAARLAAMVPSPRRYDRLRETPYLAERTAIILGRMNSAQIP
ncbi:MAG: monofunctional biosynthetic peptidoglycan transglycosylase [Burkholderiales bacterium]